ncbi:MAG: NAD(P)-dependent oxidoreductase [Nitrospiraceae bacterium]
MKLLVTGSRGFVGRSIAEYALRQGHQVIGVTHTQDNTPGAQIHSIVIPLDSADFVDLINSYSPDAILHAAGSASVGHSFQQPREDFLMAVETWGAVLDAVRKSWNNPLVLFPSSAAVYGNPHLLPISELATLQPISPYGFHKVICEQLAQEYCRCFGLRVAVTRLFSTIGAYQQRLLVWELFRQTREDSPYLTLQGSGDETRDFLHIDDIAEYLLGLAHLQPDGFSVVNMGSGTATSVQAIAQYVLAAVGREQKILPLNRELPGDPKAWQAEVTQLRRLVPHTPRSIQQAIETSVRYWLSMELSLTERDVACGDPVRP